MKIFAYTFKTWALAQVLHPIVFLIYLSIRNSVEPGFWIGALFFIFLVSFFASIPSLLIAWLLFYVISNTDLTTVEKFIAWIFSVPVAIVVNFFLLGVLTDNVIDNEINEIILPPLIAGVLIVLSRVKSFFFFQTNFKTN